ncbi:hypothetical protein GCM10023215_05070 [Pseudonocardia yuanmonensis]|uniref:Aminoglycoside phosphotransferase domain-containing protein n=1 Tax=Pseudonocardia yuanmonensis TaxID=1095914 RepID=A0ABP8W0K0_9PSEU
MIVSEWLNGEPLGALVADPARAPRETRDRYAHTIVGSELSSPARLGLLHADPHPGVLADRAAAGTAAGTPPRRAGALRMAQHPGAAGLHGRGARARPGVGAGLRSRA